MPLDGRKWKEMRSNLSPGALCKNLKSLLGNVLDVVPYLVEAIEDCASEKRDIDVREVKKYFRVPIPVVKFEQFTVTPSCAEFIKSRWPCCKKVKQTNRLFSKHTILFVYNYKFIMNKEISKRIFTLSVIFMFYY